MLRTLKRPLTKLNFETDGDWVVLLPFAFYRVRHTPYMLGLTPYEVVFGRPPPLPTLPNLKSKVLAEIDDSHLPDSLEHLVYTQKELWPNRKATFEAASPSPPQTAIADRLSWLGQEGTMAASLKSN